MRSVPGGGMTVFEENGPARVARHVHPVWKIVLPERGPAVAGRISGAGLLVPPQLAHTAAVSSAYTALFVDPWLLRPRQEMTVLDERAVRRMRAALGSGAALTELVTLAGPGPLLDPRVAHALDLAADLLPIDVIAAEVGLSPPRLRALVRASVGIPLVRLRQWARLRAAVTLLGLSSVASAAATAGFADQAHLARTSRALLGRTPVSLAHRATPATGLGRPAATGPGRRPYGEHA
ncbi:helix-turn-helix domain-containing protein [Nonomuraea dietziae]|uniref:AraC-like DNA-binding protein n=1 Tax=Nonomuraea dietziae TaxID=65515 RepID=A0A7W5UUH1_9ACTN|nr:helix-turn-helix domain-containing protein [Nonomuraea dietziae]MBB3724857.1 AraC-like DNA-binding protein [Nonomuraea dietziae]